jgi:hypothetical protein
MKSRVWPNKEKRFHMYSINVKITDNRRSEMMIMMMIHDEDNDENNNVLCRLT